MTMLNDLDNVGSIILTNTHRLVFIPVKILDVNDAAQLFGINHSAIIKTLI
jgi:hypothetical protein